MSEKQRLDAAMVQRGLSTGREQAKRSVMAGVVYVNGQKAAKASQTVGEQDEIVVKGELHPFVSRGGLKLDRALSVFPLTVSGLVCADVGASIPKNMFEYLREVNNNDAINGQFSGMNFNLDTYAEVGLGYSRQITDKLTVGGRVKVLLGIARAEMAVNNFKVTGVPNNPEDPYSWVSAGAVSASATVDAQVSTTMKGGGLSFNEDPYNSGVRYLDGFDIDGGSFGIAGTGFGIDLGASYKVWNNLTVSAAVLDLGFIKWKGSETIVASPETSSVTVNQNNYQDFMDGDFLSMDRFNLTEDEGAAKDVKNKLASTILLAGEYALLNNKLSVGAMYTARFVEPKTMNELTFSATFRPKNWLNAAVSYSPIQAGGKSLGVALKLGPLFVGTDYMFFGNNSKSVNGFFGLSFPMGGKRASNN